MANTLGRQQVVGFGTQTARGSAKTADYFFRRNGDFDEGRNVEHLIDDSALGVNSPSRGVDVSKQWAEPTIPFFVDIASFGAIEYHNADSYSKTANADPAGTVVDHTYKVGTVASLSDKLVTINVEDLTLVDQNFVDAILNSIKLNFDMSSRVSAEASFISKYPVSGATTVAFTDPTYFMGRHVTIKLATSVSGLANASAMAVKSGSLERSNNVNGDDTAFNLGSADIADHHMRERTATLTLNKFLADNTYLDYLEAGTEVAVQIAIVDTTATIGTAENPSLVYTFPKMSVKSEIKNGISDIRSEDLVLTAHYGLDDVESASYLYKVGITNLVADYA